MAILSALPTLYTHASIATSLHSLQGQHTGRRGAAASTPRSTHKNAANQWNWAVSVDPLRAVVEDWPEVMALEMASK